MTFNSLHDTAGRRASTAAARSTLSLTAGVVGGYGTLLVFFAVASTLTVNVRQRAEEIEPVAPLRGHSRHRSPAWSSARRRVVALAGVAAGDRPRDARRAGAARDVPGQRAGRAGGRTTCFGPIALSAGVAITLLAAVGAAFLAVRRAARHAAGAGHPARGCAASRAPRPRRRGVRVSPPPSSWIGRPRTDVGPGVRRDPALRRLRDLSPSMLRGLLGLLGPPITVLPVRAATWPYATCAGGPGSWPGC